MEPPTKDVYNYTEDHSQLAARMSSLFPSRGKPVAIDGAR